MNKKYKKLLNEVDINNTEKYQDTCNKIVKEFKHNIAQNLRIARKLSKKAPEYSSQALCLEYQSLRRIESEHDRDEFSLKVLILATIVYDQDIDFYFKDWKENEKLLKAKKQK